MSIIITEEKRGRRSVYHAKNLNEAGVPVSDETYTSGVKFRKVNRTKDGGIEVDKGGKKDAKGNGKTQIFILDRNGHPYEDACDYINNICDMLAPKSRKLVAQAIAFYRMYMDMTSKDARKPSYQDIEEFRNFLAGRTVIPEPGHTVTYRSAKTCNIYMSIVKTYLKLTDGDYSAFTEDEPRRNHQTYYMDAYGRRRRTVMVKNPHRMRVDPLEGKELPAHPKPDQMIKLLELAKNDSIPGVYWGAYIQYRTGIRRGGLLGLTIEDVCAEKDGDDIHYCIYLRNRVTDNDDQGCKELYHPVSKDEYRGKECRESIQRIRISKKLHDGLIRYYETSRDAGRIGEKMRRQIMKNTAADSVLVKNGVTHYIFIHPKGTLLTGQTYNRHLKQYYRECGITVDEGHRKYNCSHQLRAGFLMFRGRYSKNPESLLQLARDAGHSSPESTLIYFNEFPEDIEARWDLFDAELDELIPDNENV